VAKLQNNLVTVQTDLKSMQNMMQNMTLKKTTNNKKRYNLIKTKYNTLNKNHKLGELPPYTGNLNLTKWNTNINAQIQKQLTNTTHMPEELQKQKRILQQRQQTTKEGINKMEEMIKIRSQSNKLQEKITQGTPVKGFTTMPRPSCTIKTTSKNPLAELTTLKQEYLNSTMKNGKTPNYSKRNTVLQKMKKVVQCINSSDEKVMRLVGLIMKDNTVSHKEAHVKERQGLIDQLIKALNVANQGHLIQFSQ